MAIDPDAVKLRWDSIRNNPDCDLALTPHSVSEYLSKPESEIVSERLLETLTQLALYRIDEGNFHSEDPKAGGDLATCEGLESFLIPAVEGALSFSSFLEKSKMGDENKHKFINAMAKDIDDLILKWSKSVFSGNPYSDEGQIRRTLDAKFQKEYEGKSINITETAAMACRVLIHLLTLKLNPAEERLFREKLGEGLDDEKMFNALKNAIAFLVRAFQKGEGQTEEERIVKAKAGAEIGSGWSWTEWEGLPPMLFFTASAVDAFAEVDLYLLRPAGSGEWEKGNDDQKKLLHFYTTNKEMLIRFQLCVEMSRRWIQNSILPYLSKSYGLFAEELSYPKHSKDYALFEEDIARVKDFREPPLVLYNNLYALQILLWSWGDWNEEGTGYDEDSKSRINRALAQLVYNYDSIGVVKEVLGRFPYRFYLPGKKYFDPKVENECEYLDSGFLPLLTRLLVLFVVYGVGDRNLLEPVIRNLYIELLQNRNRTSLKYSAMWAAAKVEVFSTQRAIQALTFYFAYARGKERVADKASVGEGIINKTGLSLVLELVKGGRSQEEARESQSPIAVPETSPSQPAITATGFLDYCKNELSGWNPAPEQALLLDGAPEFLDEIDKVGDALLADVKSKQIKDTLAARLILNALARISSKPSVNRTLRKSDLELLKEQHKELRGND